jgi:3-phenylpropionate/trans-cinnamate dioxygenase ferredoxin reductase component
VYRGDPATKSFTVFQMLQNAVVGSISVNAGRDMRFARKLIASAKAVDPETLSNDREKLQDLCR